ncbi:hypothetical protein AVEN_25268-1 [Araneus ventricosus]|uniref:Uncharacterized protein n=1 Tax=Araneus ventricosus TaxID=182803 RepID=A0A4Y2VH86_ARAVE|nr:hypothetical protein AVEN_25268-1 [Araneus ventricosus]
METDISVKALTTEDAWSSVRFKGTARDLLLGQRKLNSDATILAKKSLGKPLQPCGALGTHLHLKDGVLYRKWRVTMEALLMAILPKAENSREILRGTHDSTSDHFGVIENFEAKPRAILLG